MKRLLQFCVLYKILALGGSVSAEQRPDLFEFNEKLQDPQGMAYCSSMFYIIFMRLQVV